MSPQHLGRVLAASLLLPAGQAAASTCTNFDFDLGSALGPAVATGNTCGAGNQFGSNVPGYTVTCAGGSNTTDVAFLWTAPFTGSFVFDTNGSTYDTALQIRSEADCGMTQLACDDDGGNGLQSLITYDLAAGDEVFIVVDGYSGSSCGDAILNIAEVACADLDADQLCDVDPADVCFGDDALGDSDNDGSCDDRDLCLGDDDTGDPDADGVCTDLDQCIGDDALGDSDNDGSCDDQDLCLGDDTTGDVDNDGICGDNDACFGNDATGDVDNDGICNDRDTCLGDSSSGDIDIDGICNDLDTTCDLGELDLGSAIGPYVATGSTCRAGFDVTPDDPTSTCGFAASGASEDVVYTWTAPFTAQWVFTTFGSSTYDSVLHARSLATGACPQLGCNDDFPGSRDASLVLDVAGGQTIAVVVDGYGIGCGDYQLSIVPTSNAGLVANTALVPGAVAEWTVVGARPGSEFSLFGSSAGAGVGPCPYPGVCLGLASPFRVLTATVPPAGSFEVSVRVPATVPSGYRATFQGAYFNAAQGAGGRTNRLVQTTP